MKFGKEEERIHSRVNLKQMNLKPRLYTQQVTLCTQFLGGAKLCFEGGDFNGVNKKMVSIFSLILSIVWLVSLKEDFQFVLVFEW